jgi:hypothetical protein
MAFAAVVWPVPPFAMATVPVTLEAVPVVLAELFVISPETSSLNDGAQADPFGAASTVLAA